MNELDTTIVLAVAFTIFLLVNLYFSVVVVRQGTQVIVERFGRARNRPLDPGLCLIVPFIDKVAHRISLKQQVLSGECRSLSSNGARVSISWDIVWRIQEVNYFQYRVLDAGEQIAVTGSDLLRSAIGTYTVEQLMKARDELQIDVLDKLRTQVADLGVEVKTFALADPKFSPDVEESLELKIKATNESNYKQQTADADLYVTNRESEGIERLSVANATKLNNYAKVIATHGHDATNYDIAINQVQAISVVGASDSTKSVILPTNVTESLGVIETVMTYLKDHQSTDKKPVEVEINSNDTDETSAGQQDETLGTKTSSDPLPDDNPNLANDDEPSQKG